MRKHLIKLVILLIGSCFLISVVNGSKMKIKPKIYDKAYYLNLAETMSKKYNIQQGRILYGLWWWESAGHDFPDGNAIGDSGKAFGMGQIHLTTARSHYRKNITSKELMNPDTNAIVSAKIFSDFLEDRELIELSKKTGIPLYRNALASYNAGPERTKKNLRKGKQPFNYDYVEKIYKRATSF